MGLESRKDAASAGSTTSAAARTFAHVIPEKLPCDQLCRLTMLESCAKATTMSVTAEGREMPGPMTVFGALNLNARNFDVELRRAAQKLENGMSGFLTQPVLSAQAVENLKKTRETLGGQAKILAGIMPVVSQRNA